MYKYSATVKQGLVFDGIITYNLPITQHRFMVLFSSTGDRQGRHPDTRPAGGVAVSLVPAARWQHSDEGGHRHVDQVSHLAGKRTGCRERSHVYCDGKWGARDDVDSKLNVFLCFNFLQLRPGLKTFQMVISDISCLPILLTIILTYIVTYV